MQMKGQEVMPQRNEKINELGLSFRFPARSIERNGVELLYKRWFRPWQALRVSAGFNNEEINPSVWYKAINSQVIKTEKDGTNHFAMISTGLEAQRQFYKRVYFFAATDLRLLYGAGRNNSSMYTLDDSLGITQYDLIAGSTTSYSTTNFRAEVIGSLGVKLHFSRISWGVEVNNAAMSYSITRSANKDANINLFDLNLGAVSNRLFVTYRF